jgi:hypothetical protein
MRLPVLFFSNVREYVRIWRGFQNVVRSAEVSDQTSNARAEFQTQVNAAALPRRQKDFCG